MGFGASADTLDGSKAVKQSGQSGSGRATSRRRRRLRKRGTRVRATPQRRRTRRQGALIGAVLDNERNPISTGGEAGFRLHRRPGEVLGEDGFIVGHEERARELRESVTFDGRGWPISGATGLPPTEAEMVAQCLRLCSWSAEQG